MRITDTIRASAKSCLEIAALLHFNLPSTQLQQPQKAIFLHSYVKESAAAWFREQKSNILWLWWIWRSSYARARRANAVLPQPQCQCHLRGVVDQKKVRFPYTRLCRSKNSDYLGFVLKIGKVMLLESNGAKPRSSLRGEHVGGAVQLWLQISGLIL